MNRFVSLAAVVFCATIAGCAHVPESSSSVEVSAAALPWPQWGGPNGDFKIAAEGLAESWPADGPPLLWERAIGEGYSTLVHADGVLYAMYRSGNDEIVAALRDDDGGTIWERRYAAPALPDQAVQFGTGPNATPVVRGAALFTLGYTGKLHALDRTTGEVLWAHDLIEDFGGQVLGFGYSASPIFSGDNLVVLVGGDRQGALGLSPADGSVVWRGRPGSVSYATPILIDVGGREQIVYFSADEVIGIDAANGELIWSFPVKNQYENNCTAPQWGDDGLLWVATQLDGGTRALRLTRDGDRTTVEEVWSSNQMSIHFWNTVRLGPYVYASIGSNASVLAGIDVRDGKILWRERGFEKVNFVHAGDRTILLDGQGRLALARLAPEGLDVLSEVRIGDGPTWTAPTLVGSTLYVRDKKTVRAFDLGA